MRKLLITLGLSGAAWAAPLHLELHFYEGREYDLTVDQDKIWYTYRSQQLAPRRLSSAEKQHLQQILNKNFPSLPSRMIQARVDSTYTLRYQQKSIVGTSSYNGPAQAQYQQFRAIVDELLRIAPVPGREIEKTDQRLP